MLLIHRWRTALYEVGEHGSTGMTPINWTASEYLYDRLTQLHQWLPTRCDFCSLQGTLEISAAIWLLLLGWGKGGMQLVSSE